MQYSQLHPLPLTDAPLLLPGDTDYLQQHLQPHSGAQQQNTCDFSGGLMSLFSYVAREQSRVVLISEERS